MDVEITEGNIIAADTEVIVNAWNRNLLPWFLLIPVGVAGAIKKAAGIKPFNELILKGPLPLGGAVLTSAGKLPYKGIIHVAGIDLLWRASAYSIRNSVSSAMTIINAEGFASAAFPVIGGSAGGFDESKAMALMLDQFKQETSGARIKIIRFKKEAPSPRFKGRGMG
jgi:O-acetyl-ADP-ribose deacetylase (regulator of RNase III)